MIGRRDRCDAASACWREAELNQLGAVSLGVAGFAAVTLALTVWKAFDRGGVTLLLALLMVVCAMTFIGLAMMTRTVVIAIFDRSRRRRRPAVIRIVRYAAKPLTRRDTGSPPDNARATAALILAVGVLIAVSFWPEVSQAFEGVTGGDGDTAAEVLGAAATPTSRAAPSGGTPPELSTATAGGPGPAPASPGAGGSPSPTPAQAVVVAAATSALTPAAVPTATPTTAATISPSATPTGTALPTATPPPPSTPVPTATATPTVVATPKPVLTAVATIPAVPSADTDGDGVPDLVELAYGSNPNDATATPESKTHDADFGADTCSDGINNDKNGGVDATGGGGGRPDVKCV